jgi:hypothetical protein
MSAIETANTPELSPREQLLRIHADSIRQKFSDFATLLADNQIPFPSGRYQFGDKGFISDEIGISEPAPKTVRTGAGLMDSDEIDREIHALLADRTSPVFMPRETRMATLMSSGTLETTNAIYAPNIDDEHGEWVFDKVSSQPATDEQVLLHSLSLSHILFSRLEYGLKVAQGKEDRAMIEKYQKALRAREGLENGIINEIFLLAKAALR